MEQMFLVTTQDSAAILPTLDRASNYMLGIIEEVLESGKHADLRIRTRTAAECKLFLDGAAPPVGATGSSPSLPAKKAAPAKKQKKAVGGGQAVPKVDKPAAPAQVKKGSNRSLVLAFINACTRETAVDAPAICKSTKLKIESIGPMLTDLFKAGLIDRVEGKPLRFYRIQPIKVNEPGTIYCKAKGRVTPIDQCKPNDASPICRVCPNIEH